MGMTAMDTLCATQLINAHWDVNDKFNYKTFTATQDVRLLSHPSGPLHRLSFDEILLNILESQVQMPGHQQ